MKSGSPGGKEVKGRTKTTETKGRMVAMGRVLAVLRNTKGLKQSEVAIRSGAKRSSISQYERGERAPDSSTLELLLSALGYRWAALDLAKWFIERLEADCRITGEEADPQGMPPPLGSVTK